MMARRFALFLLFASVIAIAAAYATAFLPGDTTIVSGLLMIFGISAMAVSMMTLGALREGEKPGVLGFAFAFVFAILMVGFSAVLLMPGPDSAASRLFLGLPPRAAIVLYGIGFLPVLVLPYIYAKTFDDRTLTEEDLRRIRDAAHARRQANARSDETEKGE